MELGKYLKNCRERLNRTQPDVASEIDIEQSYLSKLESGKSIPSNQTFDKLVKAYNIEIKDLVSTLSEPELEALRSISAISNASIEKKKQRLNYAKKSSIVGLSFLAIGTGLFTFSILPDRSPIQFNYRSEGVLELTEDLNTFDIVYRDVQELNDQSLIVKREKLLKRLQQEDVLTENYKGEGYIVNSSNGRRFFKLVGQHQPARNFWNRWFLAPSLMLLVAGIGCFFASKRWSD